MGAELASLRRNGALDVSQPTVATADSYGSEPLVAGGTELVHHGPTPGIGAAIAICVPTGGKVHGSVVQQPGASATLVAYKAAIDPRADSWAECWMLRVTRHYLFGLLPTLECDNPTRILTVGVRNGRDRRAETGILGID